MVKLRIFSDVHHAALFESLRILFEDRLGYELYRPIGVEWYPEFWCVYDHPATVEQFLGLHLGAAFEELRRIQPEGKHVWVNEGLYENEPGIYYIPNKEYNVLNRAITLEKFKNTKFDIIVSSIYNHFPKFEQLRKLYQPGAKHIFQMGNQWPVPEGCQNLLNSTTVEPPANINHVRYHQEFSLKIFSPQAPKIIKSVANFTHYQIEPELFLEYERLMPDWVFKAYGAGNRDGGSDNIAQDTKDVGFVWHIKQSDGYGHVIHNSYTCGKPVITRGNYLKGTMCAKLFEHGVNCVDLDQQSKEDSIKMLNSAADNYEKWSSAAYNRFKEVVDFEADFVQIQQFLANLR